MKPAKYGKALVTGGAGFIGSHIAERLLDEGLDVSVVDDLSMGSLENVPEGAQFHEGSITDEAFLKRVLKGVDVVFHNAARVSIRNSFATADEDAETNALGTVRLLKACGSTGVRKFIYASSMAVYGERATVPVREDSPLEPTSPYGVSKLAGEHYVRLLSRHFGFEGVALRYFNTFGTRQTLTPYVGVITIFIRSLLAGKAPVVFGGGAQVRDFVHVEDVAEANVRAMALAPDGTVLNVGTGAGTSINEIALILVEKIGHGIKPVSGAFPEGEPKDSVADVRSLKEALGFVPPQRLRERIDEVIEWNRLKAMKAV